MQNNKPEEQTMQKQEDLIKRIESLQAALDESNERLHRATSELQQTQIIQKAIIDSTSDYIWAVDSTTFGLLSFNETLRKHALSTGRVLSVGDSPTHLFGQNGNAGMWENLYKKALKEGSYTREYNTLAGNQTLELTFNLLEKEGTIFGIAIFGKNITQRKTAEKELEESLARREQDDKKFRFVFENLQDVYYETTVMGMILEVSPSINHLTKGHYKRNELLGKNIDDFYSNKADRSALIQKLLTDGAIEDYEISMKLRDNSIVICAVTAQLLLREDGMPDKIIGGMRDITARKNLEKETQNSLDKFSTIFNLSPFGSAIINLETRCIVDCNHKLSTEYGYSKEELTGAYLNALSIYANPADRHEILHLLESTGYAKNYPCELRKKDGSVVHCLISAEKIQLDNCSCALVTIQDITELHETHILHKESQALLKAVTDSTSDQIWALDYDSLSLIYRNAAVDEYCKKNWGTIVKEGAKFEDIHPQASPTNADLKILYKEAKEKGGLSFDYTVPENGDEFEIKLNILYRNGEPFGISTFAKNVTTANQTKRRMVASEQQFREVLENSQDALYKRNLKTGGYDYLSPVFSDVVGFTQKDFEQLTLDEVIALIHPDDIPSLSTKVTEALSNSESVGYEAIYRFKNKNSNEYIRLLDRFKVIRDTSGNPESIIGCVRDLK